MKINVLSDSVIDQIAAGEIVDRPAHLVKELIENSLDSGAQMIRADVGDGGRKIDVQDDGSGVDPKELKKVFLRHHTSKIAQLSDLWNIHSFGYRGEALASIGSVARVSFLTREKNRKVGSQIKCDFGELSEIESVGSDFGTRVTVENLFENQPVRLKFLKSSSAEINQIKRVFKALAMANPKIGFQLKVDGKLVFYWGSEDNEIDRARAILDIEDLYFCDQTSDKINLQIFYTAPNKIQRSSQNIWLFVQKRWVQSKSIAKAVMDSYRNLLMHGEFPNCVVFLDLDPQLVDVNVHPSKSEVKFQNQSEIFRLVQGTLRKSLENAPWIQALKPDPKVKVNMSKENQSGFESNEFFKSQWKKRTFDTNQSIQKGVESYSARSMEFVPEGNNFQNVYPSLKQNQYTKKTQNSNSFRWQDLDVIGQSNLTYVLAQNSVSLFLIDQHAAHERVAFERLRNNWKNGIVDSQKYLIPIVVNFSEEEVDALMGRQKELDRIGIDFDRVGPDSIALREGPALVKDSALKGAIEKLVHEIVKHGGSFAVEKVVMDIFATMACHSVIRAGKSLSLEEMNSLLKEMDEYPLSSFCPHGRPVYIEMPFSKIERDFGRIV